MCDDGSDGTDDLTCKANSCDGGDCAGRMGDFDADCVPWSADACPFDADTNTCSTDCVLVAQTAEAPCGPRATYWNKLLDAFEMALTSDEVSAAIDDNNDAALSDLFSNPTEVYGSV